MRAVEIIEQVRATRGPSSSRAAPGSCRSARRAPRRWLGRPPSSRFPLSPTTAASTSSSTAAHLLGRQGIPGYPVDGAPADDRLRPHARHDDARVDVFEGAEPDICSPRVRDAPADKLVPMSLSSRTVDSAADRARVRHAGHSGDPGDRAMGSNAARRVQWMSCSTNGAGPPRDNLLSALIAAEEAGELLTDAALQSTVVPFDVSRPCPARAESAPHRACRPVR